METQKIINLLNDSSNEECKFPAKKWYVIEIQTAKDNCNQNSSIKIETETIKSGLCDYSTDHNTDVTFKNCEPFSTCKTE